MEQQPWRRVRDLNPRWGISPHTISSRVFSENARSHSGQGSSSRSSCHMPGVGIGSQLIVRMPQHSLQLLDGHSVSRADRGHAVA